MIQKHTVLILGAGASKDYGYPLGGELKSMILEKSYIPPMNEAHVRNHIGVTEEYEMHTYVDQLAFLHKNCNFSIEHLKQFRHDFESSPRTSIDAFLLNRDEYLSLGKMLISLSILGCEDYSLLSNRRSSNEWYGYLFNVMTGTWENFTKNKLTIITYNYDRSFEVYFISALKATFSKSEQECIDAFNSAISIIHVHGRLEDIDTSVRKYGPEVSGLRVRNGASKLRIIHEKEVESNYSKIYEALQIAEQIFILGFGFDKTNLERLHLGDYNAPIFATRLGITNMKIEEVRFISHANVRFSNNNQRSIVELFEEEASLLGLRIAHMM